MCQTSLLKIPILSLFIQLYIVKVPIGSGSGENFPAPTKKVRIRIRPDADPQPWLEVTYIPAKVDAACCSDWSIPLVAPYLAATWDSGISWARSCSARAV